MEENLFQNLLSENIRKRHVELEKEIGEKLPFVVETFKTKENKNKRIYKIEPAVTNGKILFNKHKVPLEALHQLEDFPNADHDDFPDCLEMLYEIAYESVGYKNYSQR